MDTKTTQSKLNGTNTANEANNTNQTDESYMELAIAQAQKAATKGEVPVGAVVVCDGRIVAQAHNLRETHADPAAHAEFIAIEKAAQTLGRWRLSDCTVYVTLEPCAMCAGLMINSRIGRCVFGARDPKAGALGTLFSLANDARLNHRFEVTPGVLADKSAELLQNFFQKRRSNKK